MRRKTKKLLKQTIGLAALSGMRTMSAPAFLSNYLKDHRSRRLKRTRLGFMQSDKTATILSLLAAGELVGDKLPKTPNRIIPGALVGRGLSGALVGATLFMANRRNGWEGAVIGLGTALASTYISFYVRKQLATRTIIPDTVLGALEDGIVVQSGLKLLS